MKFIWTQTREEMFHKKKKKKKWKMNQVGVNWIIKNESYYYCQIFFLQW